MSRWALIRGSTVLTVVEQDTQPNLPGFTSQECTGTRVGPGWLWDGSQFIEPSNPTSITLREFWQRFTPTEREAIQNKLATGTQPVKDKINAFREYLQAGGNVELDDDYVVASVTAIEQAGVIAAGRADEILTP